MRIRYEPDRWIYAGPSFWSLLCLMLIGLKLGGCIDWSWWLVLAPIWAPIVVWLLVVFLIVTTLVD